MEIRLDSMRDRYMIGVDNIGDMQGYEVTLINNFTIVSNAKFEGKLVDVEQSVIEYLVTLAKEYKCQISIDAIGCRFLILAFKRHSPKNIKELYKTFNDLMPSRFELGFYLNARKKDSWDNIKEYINFNEEYEGSTMIAALSLFGEMPEGWTAAFGHLQELREQAKILEIQLGLYETDSN